MCFYLRLSGSLLRNLAARLCSDLGDWLALNKRRLLYRLLACVSSYDDVGPLDLSQEDPLSDQAPTDADLEGSWFVNTDRKTAQELVTVGGEGCFLIRKSARYPLTLTVFHLNRAFNIPLRKREDGMIALGFRKQNERTFVSIEELISFHQKEELILFSGGEKSGTVILQSPPDKGEIEKRIKPTFHNIMIHVPQS